MLASAPAGWAAQSQAKWQPGLASQASPSRPETKSRWFRTLCLVNKSAIWHFIMLILKSYKNLKLAMVSIQQAGKCATCLTLSKWFLTQSGELLNCSPSFLYSTNLWKEIHVWKMYCAEGQRERVTATVWFLTWWLFTSLGLLGQRNYFCTEQTFAKFGIIFITYYYIIFCYWLCQQDNLGDSILYNGEISRAGSLLAASVPPLGVRDAWRKKASGSDGLEKHVGGWWRRR